MKLNNFQKVLMIGLVGLLLVIVADIFQIIVLRILGVVNLAVVFVINSRLLNQRINKLEEVRKK